jgi:hypothetical protein
MDRVDRRRAMITSRLRQRRRDLLDPLVATFGHLSVWLIYAVTFVQSTVFIAFSAGSSRRSEPRLDRRSGDGNRPQATYSAGLAALVAQARSSRFCLERG